MKNNENEINKNETKVCPNCKEYKSFKEFYKCKSRKDGLQAYCKICKKERFKESKKKSDKKYGSKWNSIPENKIKKNKYSREYQIKNPEQQKSYHNKFLKSEKGKKYHLEYKRNEYKEKYGIDILWTLKLILRNRLKNALINNFKSGKTLDLLGCSIKEFKLYLENKFDDNMNWYNRGSYWEIDHIKPCDAFNLLDPEEQKLCFHYSNLQPLEKSTNRIKSNKYE